MPWHEDVPDEQQCGTEERVTSDDVVVELTRDELWMPWGLSLHRRQGVVIFTLENLVTN